MVTAIVVNHHGSTAADGHYTTDVKRPDDMWVRVDDTLMDQVTGRQVTEP